MNTVYVVIEWPAFQDGKEVHGVYASPEAAMQAHPDIKWKTTVWDGKTSWYSYDGFDIEPYEVQS